MSAEPVLHCAWCDGEGRCAGVTVGSVCLNGADTSPEAVNAIAFRLATIEAYPFTSAKDVMQRGAVMIRALAARQAQADERIRELVDIGYSLTGMLEGVTQDDRDRIDVAAGITQAEWFRRQEALIERALKVLWPDGEPNPHLREPFPAKPDDDVFAEALAKIGGASP
jgi:hypothetical protein